MLAGTVDWGQENIYALYTGPVRRFLKAKSTISDNCSKICRFRKILRGSDRSLMYRGRDVEGGGQ